MLACGGCDESGEAPEDPLIEESSTGLADEGQNEPPAAEADCEGEGACADGALCDVYDCGGRPARYNHFGCARVSCDADTDCPTGEACFALAYDRSCEASSTVCFEDGDACVCEATDDCEGILDAHCLPAEFYPTQEYCDPSQWACDELDDWQVALLRAAEHHAEGPLSLALVECAAEASKAAQACR